MESYGDRAAAVYARLIDPVLRRLRRQIASLCKTSNARSVLDIACATGAQCRCLHASGLDVTGLDLSASMLLTAQRLSPEHIAYVQASALELPFDADTFDVAILSLALHEHPEDERVEMLAEATRVTRPGGLLILADYHRPDLAALHPAWWAIQLIEWQAGDAHTAGFRDFMARGGLGGFVRRGGLQAAIRRATHGGAIAIAAIPVSSRDTGGR